MAKDRKPNFHDYRGLSEEEKKWMKDNFEQIDQDHISRSSYETLECDTVEGVFENACNDDAIDSYQPNDQGKRSMLIELAAGIEDIIIRMVYLEHCINGRTAPQISKDLSITVESRGEKLRGKLETNKVTGHIRTARRHIDKIHSQRM